MMNIAENEEFLIFARRRKNVGFLFVGISLLMFASFIVMMVWFPNLIATKIIGDITFGVIFLIFEIFCSVFLSLLYYKYTLKSDLEQEKYKRIHLEQSAEIEEPRDVLL